jgi:hypothetical protein
MQNLISVPDKTVCRKYGLARRQSSVCNPASNALMLAPSNPYGSSAQDQKKKNDVKWPIRLELTDHQ